jgi:hypothetical protein
LFKNDIPSLVDDWVCFLQSTKEKNRQKKSRSLDKAIPMNSMQGKKDEQESAAG